MIKKIFMALIRVYRKSISPLLGPNKCKYQPCCSEYALTAIERYGAFKGGYLAINRILRCNPLSKGGYDPVPEDKLTQLRRS